MKRAMTIVLAAAAIAVVCLTTAAGFASSATANTSQVTIVLATGLTWADVTPTSTPTLWRLAEQGAVGDVNSRARFRETGEPPSALEGALGLSAGNWAAPSFLAGAAYDASEAVGADSAAAVYRRFTGLSVGDAAICFTGLPMTVAANSDPLDQLVVGTLGQAVHDAGGITGAIGNSDASDGLADSTLERPAAVAAMDERGLVDVGDVSADLLSESATAPYGRATDLVAFERALIAFDAAAITHGGPRLLVLDPGDAYRAGRDSVQVSPRIAEAQRAAAVRELDRVVGLALDRSGSADSVIVVSEALLNDPGSALQGFGPILASGPGLHGYLSSASTHRAGVVTNPDVTAAALQALGLARPVQVIGSALTSSAAPESADQRVAHLSALDSTAISIDGLRASVADAYIKLLLAVLGLGGLLIAFRDRFVTRTVRLGVAFLQAAALILLALPPACWAMFLLTRTVASMSEAAVQLLVTTAVLWGAAVLVWRVVSIRAAAASLTLFAVALLLVDQFLGAPLSFVNFMGYSPLQSARYYGIGNEAAAFIVGAALVGVALVLDGWTDAPWARVASRIGLPLLGAIVVVAAAAPSLGANVGVAIWGSAGFVVAWALMNGRRVTWRTVVVAVLIIVVLIAGFAVLDVLGTGPKTHLARSLASAQQGGLGQLWLIVTRKAQTNARVLGETEWAMAFYAVLGFLAVMRLRGRPDLVDTLAENPAFRSAVIATLVASVIAFFTEDSGIILPAFLVLSMGAGLVVLMLSRIAAEMAAG